MAVVLCPLSDHENGEPSRADTTPEEMKAAYSTNIDQTHG
jgi:hypothetical protein